MITACIGAGGHVRDITARETLKTSGMPDALAATLSAQKFAFLAA